MTLVRIEDLKFWIHLCKCAISPNTFNRKMERVKCIESFKEKALKKSRKVPKGICDHLLGGGGGRIAQWIAFALRTQRPQVRFSVFPRFFRRNSNLNLDVIEIY